MVERRARNIWEIGCASFLAEWSGRPEHLPHWREYPDALVERVALEAGGGLEWRLSTLRTPRVRPSPWKVVVITGAPSWAEYWTAELAQLGPDREMVVVDRPGFGGSEPQAAVLDIETQVRALLPLLTAIPGQKLLLVGQSYGAALAAALAAARPERVEALLLLSPLWGALGPTAERLVSMGERIRTMIPRDLRNAVDEVRAQASQLDVLRRLLAGLRAPTLVLHGEQDDFAPLEAARSLADELAAAKVPVTFRSTPGDHFLAQAAPDLVLAQIEAMIAQAEERQRRPAAKKGLGWLKRLRLPAARAMRPA